MFTLAENIRKQSNLLLAIANLTDSNTYYYSSYKPQYNCDKRRKRQLRKCLKKLKRLTTVIDKQSKEFLKNSYRTPS